MPKRVPQFGEAGYERNPADLYVTPAWVTQCLIDVHGVAPGWVWEPACGTMAVVVVLRRVRGVHVYTSDIRPIRHAHDTVAFQDVMEAPQGVRQIITNPPYADADGFVRHAVSLMEPVEGLAAMLLNQQWDTASGRHDLFRDHPAFHMKITLTQRIRWIEGTTVGPRKQHAWYIWDWSKRGQPSTNRWAP